MDNWILKVVNVKGETMGFLLMKFPVTQANDVEKAISDIIDIYDDDQFFDWSVDHIGLDLKSRGFDNQDIEMREIWVNK